MFYESVFSVIDFPADFANMEDRFEVDRYVFVDLAFLFVGLAADGAGETGLSVHVEVLFTGEQRGEELAALPAPVLDLSVVLALMHYHFPEFFETAKK